ncbi:PDZ and LIM domain protein 2 isoform X2 [Caloenas nicobarica]|uniref:PDZ and LIM domain protein 2 isoform X2 n=1 Tax=Caloenas nicobarica TaxID=187106 RepID=UPI0032B7AFB7
MGRGFGVSSRHCEAQPRKFFRAASQAPLCAFGIFKMPSSAVADGVPGSRGHPEAVPVGRGWGGAGSLSQRLGEGAAHSHGSHGARRGALGTLCHPGGRSASFPDAGFAVGCRTRGAGACGEQQDPSLAGCWLPSQPHCPLQTPLAWPCRATNCQGGTDFLPCARPRGQRGDLACPVPPAAPTQPAVGPQDPCVPRGFLAGEEATSPSWGNQGGKRKRRWLPAPCDSAGTRVPSPEGRRCRCLPPRVWDPWGAGLGGATGLCLPEEQRAPRDFPTPPLPARPEPPAAMPVTVTLAGPAPWGFRLTGGRDFGKPITVSKVTEHGKAAAGDLRPGDIIIAINGESTAEMLNVEAQNKIKQSPGQLQLQVERSEEA